MNKILAVPEWICPMLACLINHPKRIRTSVKLYFFLPEKLIFKTKPQVIISYWHKAMLQETAICILEICGVQLIFHMKSSFHI